MARLHPQITVIAEAEAVPARAEVRSVPTPQVVSAAMPYEAHTPYEANKTEELGQHDENDSSLPKDYFIEKDGLRYAGSHLIVDMWNASGLDDEDLIQRALLDAVERAGATLLHIHTHKFSEGGGVSGVAVLAESHISVHTWPERSYAAFDIFMCGEAQPARGVQALKDAFGPCTVTVAEHKRGVF